MSMRMRRIRWGGLIRLGWLNLDAGSQLEMEGFALIHLKLIIQISKYMHTVNANPDAKKLS